jgi:hypothetical protein
MYIKPEVLSSIRSVTDVARALGYTPAKVRGVYTECNEELALAAAAVAIRGYCRTYAQHLYDALLARDMTLHVSYAGRVSVGAVPIGFAGVSAVLSLQKERADKLAQGIEVLHLHTSCMSFIGKPPPQPGVRVAVAQRLGVERSAVLNKCIDIAACLDVA